MPCVAEASVIRKRVVSVGARVHGVGLRRKNRSGWGPCFSLGGSFWAVPLPPAVPAQALSASTCFARA